MMAASEQGDAENNKGSLKMKCILHVGPPKTGSTTIQSFLRQNKEILLAKGILALAHNEIQRKLPFFFKTHANLTPWAKRKQLDHPEKMEALKKDTHNYINSQIKKHKPDILILSSEGLPTLPTADMMNMRDYLRGFAAEIEILIFLRRSDFRILSSYKNMVRNKGITADIDTEYSARYDDGNTIRNLGECFGSDKIIPVICKDSHPRKAEADGHIEALLKVLFKNADVTQDDFIIPNRKNIAWDFKAVYYMREFNKIAKGKPEFEQYRRPLARLLQEHFSGGEKLRIKKSVAETIVENHKAGWEDIRQQYFPDQDTLFHMDFSMYDEDTSSQKFGTEEAVLVSLVLIESFLEDRTEITGVTAANEISFPG